MRIPPLSRYHFNIFQSVANIQGLYPQGFYLPQAAENTDTDMEYTDGQPTGQPNPLYPGGTDHNGHVRGIDENPTVQQALIGSLEGKVPVSGLP